MIVNNNKYRDNQNIFVSWDTSYNKILNTLLGGNNENIIYTKGQKINTVQKCVEKLLNGQNIIIFLYSHSDSTGAYNIAKKSNCDVFLARIFTDSNVAKSSKDVSYKKIYPFVFSTLFKHYHLEYDIFNKPTQDETPQEYMTRLKQQLYLEN